MDLIEIVAPCIAAIAVGHSFDDTYFTTLDAARAEAVLAKIVVHTVSGSKKRRREDRRGTQPCYEYARTGVCKFGEACRYGHDTFKATTDESAKVVMRKLATQRAANFTAGGSSAGVDLGADDVGGGGASGGAGAAAEDIRAEGAAPEASDAGAVASDTVFAAAAVTAPPTAAGAAAESVLKEADAGVVALVGLAALVGPTVTPLSMVARFYTRLFSPGQDVTRRSEDQYVHLQANRIAIVGIAPAHPLLRLRLAVKSVVFNVALVGGPALTGKHKHGAAWIEADTVIATATTEDGRTWPLRAGVRANLLELNSRLEAEPWLLTAKAPTTGFLAVVNMQLKRVIEVTAGLLSEEDYAELCTARALPGPRATQ